eukprot:XP_011451854.1 PREDICTED: uncharacterized protein LOC105345427 [Crassostrea gigas]
MTMMQLKAGLFGFVLLLVSTLANATLSEAIDAYANKDYQTAYRLFLPLAESGNPYAQYGLAKLYASGDLSGFDEAGQMDEGVKRDELKAFNWYQKAANQSYGIAQNNLGLFYEVGKGTQKDIKQAKHWFNLACDNRCSEGCKNLQRLEFEE